MSRNELSKKGLYIPAEVIYSLGRRVSAISQWWKRRTSWPPNNTLPWLLKLPCSILTKTEMYSCLGLKAWWSMFPTPLGWGPGKSSCMYVTYSSSGAMQRWGEYTMGSRDGRCWVSVAIYGPAIASKLSFLPLTLPLLVSPGKRSTRSWNNCCHMRWS